MDDSKASFIDSNNPEYGMRLHFQSNEVCNATTGENYAFTFDIRCDDDVFTSLPYLQSSSVEKNSCNPKVFIDHDAGCVGKSFNRVWTFMAHTVNVIGITLIVTGVFMSFFGSKYEKSTLFISVSSATFLILFVRSLACSLISCLDRPIWLYIAKHDTGLGQYARSHCLQCGRSPRWFLYFAMDQIRTICLRRMARWHFRHDVLQCSVVVVDWQVPLCRDCLYNLHLHLHHCWRYPRL